MGRAVFLENGRLAIGDWEGQRILLFDSIGSLTGILGRAGSGPGEFRAPVLVQAFAGDSLLVWDPYLRRVTRLSASTGAGHSIDLPTDAAYGSAPIVGRLADGRLVLRHERFTPAEGDGAPLVTTEVRLASAEGTRWETLATLDPVPQGDAGGYRFFAPRAQVAVVNGRVLFGIPTQWNINTRSLEGAPPLALHRAWAPRPVTPSDRSNARAAVVRPDMAPGFADDDRFDATWPAFGTILQGPRGTTWVLDYAAPYLSPDSVSVFSDRGALLGVLALPSGFKPTDVGESALLGVARTPTGDLEIRRHALRWVTP
jgi:hypothetical protein